jgi:DNA repair exonuclease SbcCD ATPase subunit
VCGNEAPGLLEVLRRQCEEKLQKETKEIAEKIEELQSKETRLQLAEEAYKTWNDKQQAVVEDLDRCRKQGAVLLEREIKEDDDLQALLNAEAGKIKNRLETLRKTIEEKQGRLSQIEEELEKIRAVDDILRLEDKKKIIEQIQQSAEYAELEDMRDRAAELVSDIESIREAISLLTNEEASDMLCAAEAAIDSYFHRLTSHPAVSAIKLKVDTDTRTQRNDYSITDEGGNDLTPFLSQGDLNALALAIFLGLAASSKDSGAFGFVLMDDPSQSLDSEHKKQLVKVLDEVAGQKQLVVSTMDGEFHSYLAEELTKAKKEYVFEAWTPDDGPTISP